MDEKKYQIFMSSTYKDLVEAREKVIETILKLYHFPVGMEMFSADDDEQWEVIQDTIDISDYYILILGHRYGSVTESGLSYTEKEYDYAKSKNIPILAFIRNRDVATKPSERDENPNLKEKLDKFVGKASSNKMCDFWENEDELATKVAIALPKIFRKTPRIGWVRGNLALSSEISEELALLSKENRAIREENTRLQNLISNRNPSIDLTINNLKSLEFDFVEKQNLNIDFNGNNLSFWEVEYPKPIEVSSIPSHLKPFLEKDNYEKINNYNSSLPSNEEIDEHNLFRELFFRLNGTAKSFVFEIHNIGNSKANEVHVDIEFPEFVTIMTNSDIKEFDHPKSPIPANPIKEAEKEYEKEQKRKMSPFSLSNFVDDFGGLSNLNLPVTRNIYDTIADLDIGKEIQTELDQENRKISIRIRSLLHTRKVIIDKYYIVPIREGEGALEITTVCEEYEEPQKTSIQLKIN